jgi:hypothetical protein
MVQKNEKRKQNENTQRKTTTTTSHKQTDKIKNKIKRETRKETINKELVIPSRISGICSSKGISFLSVSHNVGVISIGCSMSPDQANIV